MPGPDPRKTKIKPLRQMTQQQKKALKQFKTKREDEIVSAMGGYKSGGRAGYKGGGMSQRGLGRAFMKGGKV